MIHDTIIKYVEHNTVWCPVADPGHPVWRMFQKEMFLGAVYYGKGDFYERFFMLRIIIFMFYF